MSMINLHRYVETEGHTKNIGVEGFYFGRAIKPGVGVTREFGVKVPCKNLITDLGMDAIGSGSNGFSAMHLGTGTAIPQFTDTSLANFGVSLNISAAGGSGNSGSSPYYGWRRNTWTSSVGGATGVWTEIGVSNQSTNGNLRSRALILDGSGQPTSFPVLADEQFEGTYEFRVYVPEKDSPAGVELSGTPYDTVTRALRATQLWDFDQLFTNNQAYMFGANGNYGNQACYTGGLSGITDNNPGGSAIENGSFQTSNAVYTNGNHYRDTSVRYGSSQSVGAIRTLQMVLRTGAFQIEYDPVINKLATEEFIHNQRISWARR